jgi:predicted RNase H-like nuclease (RuvC/YqgF family)
MQTIILEIEDSCFQNFMSLIESKYKDNIKILKDKNLELDPYFYERQKELQKIRNNIKNRKSKLISFSDFENRVDNFEKELESRYGN